MRKIPIMIMMMAVILLLTSCVNIEQVEKLSLITAVGYDAADKDKIEGTTVVGQFDPSKKGVSEVTTATAFTSKMIRQKMNLGTRNKMVSGQLRVVVFGSELSKRGGLINILDTLSRDPAIGTMVYVAVSKTTAKDILRFKPKQGNLGNFMYELIQQNIKGELLLSCTLHEFLQDYYDPGRDPVMPLFEKKNNKVSANGIALVSEDHLAGTLSPNESFYVKLIREQFKTGNIELQIPIKDLPEKLFMTKPKSDNLYLNIDEINSNSKIKVMDKSIPSFQIELDLDIRLQEITEDILIDAKSLKILEKNINKVMSKEAESVIKKLQKFKSDPIGFGAQYNAERGIQLKGNEWYDRFPNAAFKINIKTSILKTGVMD